MMSYAQTRTELKTILDTVSSSVLPQKFNYVESKPDSFPAAIISYQGGQEKTLDQQYNEINQRWVISLIFPAEETQAGMDKWINLVDAITAEYRKEANITLNGNAIAMRLTDAPPPTSNTEGYIQPVVIFDLLFEVKIIKSL